jgi:hypothetical protein
MGVSVFVALALKLVPFALMATAAADRYLIVVAVASDVLGIAWVLMAAMSLLHIKPQFANSPCGANQNSMTEIVPAVEAVPSTKSMTSTKACHLKQSNHGQKGEARAGKGVIV